MKPLQNTIKVLSNSLGGKAVDMGSLADGRVLIYDAGTDEYTHVDFPYVTFEALLASGDIGTGADQVAYGNHLHTGVYEQLINKSLSIVDDQFSDIKYPTTQAVKTYADAVAARISTGCITSPDLIDNGDGTATITSTSVNIYPAPDYMGIMQTHVVPQATLLFTDNSEEFVSVRFNLGSPVYTKETVGSDMNHSDILPIFTVWRLGTVIHSLSFDSLGSGLANKAQSAMYHTSLYEVSMDRGLDILETTNPSPRSIEMTGGIVYTGAIHQDVGPFNSSTDQMTEAINTPTGWSYSNVSVYNNTQFNNGTSLADISNNKYAVRWWYRSIGDAKQLFYVLGVSGSYHNPTDASLELPRSDLSPILKRHCLLVGRSIIQYNATSGTTQSLLDEHYAYSSVINHDDTGNISLVGPSTIYGHISNLAQTIYGAKTFNSSPIIPTAAANTNSTIAASTAYADAKVADAITNGVTLIAPSQSAVFGALALKFDKSVLVDTKALTGFLAGDGINVSYNWTNRTITLTGDLRYVFRGEIKTLVSPWTSVAHTATLGNWYLMSVDGTNFTWATVVWAFEDLMVSAVRYKATSAESFAIRETHGVMDYQTHEELHTQLGTYLESGGKPVVGTYIENTNTDAATSPSFSAAVIKDEDSKTTIPLWAEGSYTTLHIAAGGIATFGLSNTTPFIAGSNAYIQVNNTTTGALTAGNNNSFYNVYQIMIPTTSDVDSQKYRMVMLQPQREYGSLAAAQAEDTRGLIFGDISSSTAEYVVYTRITYATSASNFNIGKCTIPTGGITYITGNRASQISVSGIATNNHSVLANLSWASSGHIGVADSLASFDSAGLASNVLLSSLAPVAGSTNIVTVGTITTGTWSATTIAINKGGTGLTTLGTQFQLLRVNAAGTELEYYTPNSSSITVDDDAPVGTNGALWFEPDSGMLQIYAGGAWVNTTKNGMDGKGWTSGSYNSSTGIVTFASNDGLGFSTTDLRPIAVTSVNMSVPTGLSISGNPITTSGTLAVDYAVGYSIPTTASQSNWDSAYAHISLTSNPHGVTATQVGLGNVTNESKATMFSSAALTGTPTAPTAAIATNTTQIATTAYVLAAIAAGGSSSITVDDIAPTGTTGALWFEPDAGILQIYAGGAWVSTTRNGIDGKGWTEGSYNAGTGVVTFTSSDGLGFVTGDLRGADGEGGGASIAIDDIVPAGTDVIWYQPTTGTLFVKVGTVWVATASNGLDGPAGPAPNNGTLTLNVSGTGLSGSATFTADQAGNSTFTVTSNATTASTPSTLVLRDAAGYISGFYRNLHPAITSLGTAIDFAEPMMTKVLTINTTFTETNKAQGRTAMVIIDRSASNYTPTFSANVKWNNATTPTWSSYRYWIISMNCYDSTYVFAAAIGYTI